MPSRSLFFGLLSDKKNRPWLMGVGILLSGSGISVLGFLHNYWLMVGAVAVSSIGMAIYHPDAGRLANYVSGKAKGKGVSNFPLAGTWLVFWGLCWLYWVLASLGCQAPLFWQW